MRHREETKRRIHEAAERVFADFGYTGASLSKIASEADLPKSNIVYYFETKENLYRVVVDDIFNVWMSAADTIRADSDPKIALGAYIDTKLELSRSRPYGSKVWSLDL